MIQNEISSTHPSMPLFNCHVWHLSRFSVLLFTSHIDVMNHNASWIIHDPRCPQRLLSLISLTHTHTDQQSPAELQIPHTFLQKERVYWCTHCAAVSINTRVTRPMLITSAANHNSPLAGISGQRCVVCVFVHLPPEAKATVYFQLKVTTGKCEGKRKHWVETSC